MIRLLLVLLFALAALAQQPAPSKPQDAPGLGIQTGDAASKPAPDRVMSQAERTELLKAVDDMLAFASKTMGMPQKGPVKREFASRADVEQLILTNLNEDEGAKRLERSALVLKKFGLIPRDMDLRSFLVAMLKEQVAGFYDPKRKTLFVLDWLPPEAQQSVMVHELAHAIQDQNFDLQKFVKVDDDPDKDFPGPERAAARQAIVEGQAMVVLVEHSLRPLGASISTRPELLDLMIGEMTKSPETPLLASAPMYLRESLIFPYSYGLRFVGKALATGSSQAFSGLIAKPPRNTYDIMFPQFFFKGESIAPFPPPRFEQVLGSGWRRYDLGEVGAFDQHVILKQFDSAATATALVPNYRGAYYWAAAPAGATPSLENLAVVFASRWATADAARQFAAAYAKSVQQRYGLPATNHAQAPGAAASSGQVKLDISPRAPALQSWKTKSGPVSIETVGAGVLVLEGFPEREAAKLRAAVFGKAAAAGK